MASQPMVKNDFRLWIIAFSLLTMFQVATALGDSPEQDLKKEKGQNSNALPQNSHINNDDELLKKAFLEFKEWDESHIQGKIKIRLLDKSWKPHGPSTESDTVLKSYKWDEETAAYVLETSTLYKYKEEPILTANRLLAGNSFIKHLPSIIIVHQGSGSADDDFVRKTITALAMRNLHLVNNIFTINMPELSYQMFVTTVKYYRRESANFESIANTIGSFFVQATSDGHISPDQIHLIGLSDSAQLVGFIGRYIGKQTGNKVASILALDPIGSPNNPHVTSVNAADAKVVHVHHTNAWPLGSVERTATTDVIFNDGLIQPECAAENDPQQCSHRSVVQRFWYVILYGGVQLFKARHCTSLIKFYFGDCNDHPLYNLTYPIEETDGKGSLYLNTSKEPPYGLGICGCTVDSETRTTRLEYVEVNKNTVSASQVDKMLFKMMLV